VFLVPSDRRRDWDFLPIYQLLLCHGSVMGQEFYNIAHGTSTNGATTLSRRLLRLHLNKQPQAAAGQ
jgi:hypothetical protein